MVKWEKIENSKVSLEIEVSPEQVEKALGQAYRKVVKKAVVPGFRKGRVPRSVLEAKFGPEVLYEDALEILIPKAYHDAVEEADLQPIDQPRYDLVQMEKGEPLIFKAEVEVKPEVKLPEYRGVKVEKKVKKIDDTHVDAYLERTRQQHARLETVEEEDYPAALGDLVVMDFKGFIDEEPFEGGEAEGYSLELGTQSFIPGFEEQLVGKKKGEELEVKTAFPEDYREENLKGKEAVFKVKIHEIKRKEFPDLDDEFAQEVSEFSTLEEFKKDIKNKLVENEDNRAARELEDELIRKISRGAEVEIPSVLVERELDRMMGDMERFLRMQGLTLEQYLKMAEKSLKDLRDGNREEGENRVKANLTLDAIIKEEGITAEEQEIDEKIASFAGEHKQEPEKVKEMFASQGRIGIIEEEVKFRKAIDFLIAEAEVETVEVFDGQEEASGEDAGPGEQETAGDGQKVAPGEQEPSGDGQEGAPAGDTGKA